jgi:hypothetical protein
VWRSGSAPCSAPPRSHGGPSRVPRSASSATRTGSPTRPIRRSGCRCSTARSEPCRRPPSSPWPVAGRDSHWRSASGGRPHGSWRRRRSAFVGRGRPASLLENVAVRGAEKGDRGFPSGHAAVSAALTVVAWPYAPNRWRATLATLAGFVPFARIYVGAHLPLDVVGGSALGLAIGSVINAPIPDANAHRVGEPLRGTRARRRRRGSDPRSAGRRSRAVTAGRTTGRHRRRTTAPARPRPEATNGR